MKPYSQPWPCQACGNWQAALKRQLCRSCMQQLVALRLPKSSRSLFLYDGLVRQLITKAKVGGCSQAATILVGLFVNAYQNHIHSAQKIIVVSSSLWSRVRGRTDLAFLLGSGLGRNAAIPVFSAPMSTGWHWRKQSAQRARKSQDLPAPETHASILIIDDVCTSGATLLKAAKAAQLEDWNYLTLATAHLTDTQTTVSLGPRLKSNDESSAQSGRF